MLCMKIIVVSSETFLAHEVAAVNALFQAGLQTFHLRKPHSSINEMRFFLQAISTEFHNRIVLHDHFSLLKEFALKGIHINMRNSIENAPNLEPLQHVSKSCHSLEELNHVAQYNYVFLSPIFDSISKQGYTKSFSHEELLHAKCTGIINEKVIALGGITPENMPQIANYGFGGVAILGSLWANFEQTNNIELLLQRFEKHTTL